MRNARSKRLATAALASVMLVVAGAAGPALADEPEPPAAPPTTAPVDTAPIEGEPIEGEPVADPPGTAVGEVDGVPVAVAEALVPPVAAVAVPAERVATATVDGVEVGLVDAPVPPAAQPAPAAVTPPAPAAAAPAPAHVPGPAVAAQPTVALVLAAWG